MSKGSEGKPEGIFKRAAREAEELAGGEARVEDGLTLYKYPDYDTYRAVQTAGNKAKLKRQFVKESHVVTLSQAIDAAIGPVTFGLCHGTRRGLEQAWFSTHLKGNPRVLGTEISDTATDFPHTIQWDFHEVDPLWIGTMDLVYSNSWDHAHDPETAFAGWISCLRPGGFLMLDHGWNYQPDRVTAMDPFGISEDGLVKMLNRLGQGKGEVTAVIEGGKHKGLPIRTVVFRATA